MKEVDQQEKTPQERTMEMIRWVGDKMVPGIKLTMDFPEFHLNGKRAMLDLQVGAQEGKEGNAAKIRHSFYQKGKTSPLVFHAGAAYGWRPKIVTMEEEFRRRLLHMDTEHNEEDKKVVIQDFLQKMADSGYQHPVRKEVIKSAVTKFYRQILEQETGGRQLYRSTEDMAEARRLKSLMDKIWFKSKRGGQSLTPRKDLPHNVQKEELEARKVRARPDKRKDEKH